MILQLFQPALGVLIGQMLGNVIHQQGSYGTSVIPVNTHTHTHTQTFERCVNQKLKDTHNTFIPQSKVPNNKWLSRSVWLVMWNKTTVIKVIILSECTSLRAKRCCFFIIQILPTWRESTSSHCTTQWKGKLKWLEIWHNYPPYIFNIRTAQPCYTWMWEVSGVSRIQ